MIGIAKNVFVSNPYQFWESAVSIFANLMCQKPYRCFDLRLFD